MRRQVGFGAPPRKGTKARKLLLMALRPEGVTEMEACAAGITSGKIARVFATVMRDQKGYDIRAFKCDPARARPGFNGCRKAYAWRLVGKMRWDGSYRSFIHAATSEARSAA